MARNDEENEGTVAVAEAPETTNEAQAEAPADGAATEGAEATATEAEKPAGPSAEEIKEAVKVFLDKAKEVAETRDRSTGEISDEQKAVVKTAYGELPTTPARTQARNGLDEAMKTALSEHLDAALARAYMILGQTVKAPTGRSETVAKAPVDPTEAFVARVAALRLSPNFAEVPEGVSEDWVALVQAKTKALTGEAKAYKEHLTEHSTWEATPEDQRGEEPAAPEVSDIVLNAYRLARGRATSAGRKAKADGAATSTRVSTYTGPRRSVKTHIVNAFADKATGTFLKIAEIANTPSAEYGDDRPSSGAVSAALFPSSGKTPEITGVAPAEVNGVKGARKA